MLVNPNSKAAKLLSGAGTNPVFIDVAAEVEKRAEEVKPGLYQFSDGSQIELILSANSARVVRNAD